MVKVCGPLTTAELFRQITRPSSDICTCRFCPMELFPSPCFQRYIRTSLSAEISCIWLFVCLPFRLNLECARQKSLDKVRCEINMLESKIQFKRHAALSSNHTSSQGNWEGDIVCEKPVLLAFGNLANVRQIVTEEKRTDGICVRWSAS